MRNKTIEIAEIAKIETGTELETVRYQLETWQSRYERLKLHGLDDEAISFCMWRISKLRVRKLGLEVELKLIDLKCQKNN